MNFNISFFIMKYYVISTQFYHSRRSSFSSISGAIPMSAFHHFRLVRFVVKFGNCLNRRSTTGALFVTVSNYRDQARMSSPKYLLGSSYVMVALWTEGSYSSSRKMSCQDFCGKLTPEQIRVAIEKGTERAFTGKYYDHHEKGTYTCICCSTPLFR